MPSPIAAVGNVPEAPTAPARPATPAAPGSFATTLASALEAQGAGAPARPPDGSGPRPTTVPLERMLAALAGTPGEALQPVPPGTASAIPAQVLGKASAEAGTAVVEQASRYLGIPYRWGGSDPATGLDCSGLVQQVFDDLGVDVPRTSVEQSRVGAPVASMAQARPGDLLFWASSRPGQANHIGIYVGEDKMLHAPYTGEVVKVAPVRSAPPTTIRRVATA